jgi:hypothetical protein
MPRRTDPDHADESPRPPRPPAVPPPGGRDRAPEPTRTPAATPTPGADLGAVPPAPPVSPLLGDALPPAGGFPEVASVRELLSGDRFERDRFQIGTVSGTWAVRELDTGKRFILKRSGRTFDAVNEVIISRFHEALGRPYPRARFVADQHGWVLLQHVDDFPDDGQLLGMGTEFVGAINEESEQALRGFVQRLADPLEPLRLLLGDYVIDNTDRHNRNWLVMSTPDGRLKIEPCDNGFALLGRGGPWVLGPSERRGRPTEETGSRWDDTDYDAYLAERLDAGATLDSYLHTRGWNPPHAFQEMTRLAVASRRVSADRVAAEYDRVVRDWAAVLDAVDLSDIDQDHVRRVRQLAATRVATLFAHRGRYVRSLTSGNW